MKKYIDSMTSCHFVSKYLGNLHGGVGVGGVGVEVGGGCSGSGCSSDGGDGSRFVSRRMVVVVMVVVVVGLFPEECIKAHSICTIMIAKIYFSIAR